MTIAIDIVGTNLGSGTKTYNINLCNEINSLNLNSNIIIFICRSYLNQIKKIKNKKVKYIIKPNFLSISIFRLLWMQLILPFELKLLGVKKIYSPMNFAPIITKILNIKGVEETTKLHNNAINDITSLGGGFDQTSGYSKRALVRHAWLDVNPPINLKDLPVWNNFIAGEINLQNVVPKPNNVVPKPVQLVTLEL